MTSSVKPDPKVLAAASRKEAQLIGLLSALSEELAVQLVEALERDRLAGGKGLPFDAIMTGLRPKLRQIDPSVRRRVPTPQRAFFEVIEGMIINDRGEEKQPGRIARRSLDPIWRWLLAHAGEELGDTSLNGLKMALLKNDREAARAALAVIDAAAAEAIRAAVKKADGNAKQGKELANTLGGHRAYEDMKELGRVLGVADEIRALRLRMPLVIDEEVPEQFGLIREAYERVVENFEAGAPYLVLSLTPRVTHPWELFGVAARLVGAKDDQDLKQSDLAMVGEWLVLGLETEAAALRSLKTAASFDAALADEILRRFAVLQAGMTREVGMRKDGVWGKRLLKARGTISNALESLFDAAVKDLQAGLRMERATSGAKSGALVPIIPEMPEAEVIARLEALMSFLQTARLFSGQLGYAVAYEEAKTEVSAHLDSFGAGVISIIHATKKPERDVPVAWAEACQKVMAQFLSEESLRVFSRRFANSIAEPLPPVQAKA